MLYWYKSTNADAEDAARTRIESERARLESERAQWHEQRQQLSVRDAALKGDAQQHHIRAEQVYYNIRVAYMYVNVYVCVHVCIYIYPYLYT